MAGPADAGPAAAAPAYVGPADAAPAKISQRRRRRTRSLAETAIIILVAVLLAFVVRAYVFQTFWIPSSSMVPTLSVYDRILVQKAFFNCHHVRAGEIVVFTHPPRDYCPGPQQGDLV